MANSEINSYEFYVKSFPFIKCMIDEKYIYHTHNVLLIIFYDVELYKKYISKRKANDFIELIKQKFLDYQIYNNEEYGVFIIGGDLLYSIDLIVKNVFIHEKNLEKDELVDLGIEEIAKSNSCFYITMIKVYFFDTKGTMSFKFNEIKNNYIDN